MFCGSFAVLITKPTWSTRIHQNLFHTPGRAEMKNAFRSYSSTRDRLIVCFRFFSHVIGHANWQHFHGNMTYLLLIGPGLELRFGSWDVAKMVLVVSAVGSCFNIVCRPNVISTGASGVVFMFILMSGLIQGAAKKVTEHTAGIATHLRKPLPL
eukprot:SAG31_NODE_3087_length_4690_cov_30.948377_7_plen_154_part_00